MKSYRQKQEQSSATYDYDDTLTEGEIADYLNDDLSVEQDYLHKLRTQRQKIEQLSKLYEANQDKLQKTLEENHKLRIENSKLADQTQYKTKYDEIKREYERLVEYSSRSEMELDSVRSELAQAIHQKSQIIQNMKQEIKASKNKHYSEKQHLEETLTDQESLIAQLKSKQDQIIKQLNEQITGLKGTITLLKEQIDLQNKNQNEEKINYSKNIANKNAQIYQLKHFINTIEIQAKRGKQESSILQQNLDKKERELKNQIQKLKYQLQQKTAQLKQKQNNNKEIKSQISKIKSKLQQQQKQNQKSQTDIKNMKENYQTKLRISDDNLCHQKARYQTIIMEFRGSIDQLMDVKNQLINENKKLVQKLRKKEQQQKLRKQLLRSECKEIDKLEKIVDKIV